MAVFSKTGGTNGGTYAKYFTAKLTVTEASYDVANNTSNVNWKLELVSGSSGKFSDYYGYFDVYINGSHVLNSEGYKSITTANTSITLGSGTLTNVKHNADGTKTIACSATIDMASGIYSPGDFNLSGNLKLTNIPRTSKVSLSNTKFNIGTSITINSNRASSSFTHKAVIKFNGSTVRTQTGIGASYSWNTTELYQYIPNANKGTGTVTLTTYNGSTEIGSSQVSFTANVTNSNPTFSNCTYEDGLNNSKLLTGNNQTLINSYNTLKVTISTTNKAVAKNGATMSKYRLVCRK